MTNRTARLAALTAAALTAVGVAAVTLAGPAGAVGARYSGTAVGTLDLRPPTGTNNSAIDYTTSAPCPGGTSYEARLFGSGLPDSGYVVTSRTEANFSTSKPITGSFFDTPQKIAERNGATLQGTYDVVVRCTDRFGDASKGDFVKTLTFTSRTAYNTTTQTASPSASPTGGSGGACQTPTVQVGTPIINATGLAAVRVTGARPGSTVELQGYSQNHFGTANFENDTTPVDRSGVADASGSVSFNDLRPASNTRLRARQQGCTTYGASAVINVRATQTLNVARAGTRTYVISGNSIPARPGGLIISLYRINGAACAAGVEPRNCPGEVQIGQGRADQSSGRYSIRVVFPAADAGRTVRLVVKTGQDAQNAPGRSNVRSLQIS